MQVNRGIFKSLPPNGGGGWTKMCQKCTVFRLPTEDILGYTEVLEKGILLNAFSCGCKHPRALFMIYKDSLEGETPLSEVWRGDEGCGGGDNFYPFLTSPPLGNE